MNKESEEMIFFSIAVDTPWGDCWVGVSENDFSKFICCFGGLEVIEDSEETSGYSRYSKSYVYEGRVIAEKSIVEI